MSPGELAGMAVEYMEPGPALAGWLEVAAGAAPSLDEDGLTGLAVAARKQAARAQRVELAAVGQIASRCAAADRRIGVATDGRPARICRDAVGQIEMALRLTHDSAETWADLACTLAWRLPRTGAALAVGWIDLDRAKIIAQATSVLSEHTARTVEEKVLAQARWMTTARLRERLHHLVIAADPQGAEERRQKAERHANVRLFSDDDNTATLLADKLPQIEAAAGFAKIKAIARARKAAGLPGSLGLHRAQVLLGLVLGTLGPTPPAEGAPPDQPPPGDDDLGPYDDNGPRPAGDGGASTDGPPPPFPPPPPADEPPPSPPGPPADEPPPFPPAPPADEPPPFPPPPPADEPPPFPPPPPADEPPPFPPPPPAGPNDEEHALGDEGCGGASPGYGSTWDPWEDNDDPAGTGPPPTWPSLGPMPPGVSGAVPADGRPPMNGLDVTLPWATLADRADRPGTLGSIGAITAAQARQLAAAAARDPVAQWRVIVTSPAGQAIAVARVPRPRRHARHSRDRPNHEHPESGCPNHDPARNHPARGGQAGGDQARGDQARAGPAARITVTISQDTVTAPGQPIPAPRQPVTAPRQLGTGPRQQGTAARQPGAVLTPAGRDATGPVAKIAADVLRIADRVLSQAVAQAEADAAAGGCAHAAESPGYRPPPRLREFVVARDVTCRNPVCGQPAWRGDLDHTIPWDDGGRTCRCNLGGACRRDHQLKQHPRWKLQQVRPGWFQWTAPSGRTYTAGPATYTV